ncbi:urea ABC transporter permease subunit UrtC [Allopusillimonas ginsengisoli]|uniref:urea ABC transporter permease subunit UrtC n=1 Tax=Allopusillimonas ginsengisoli TaxID=453575 RepID=UPI0010C1B050|nr:urea ABC transporter permease subunit UrtC [Allopusillimonas ginsengisoli]
MNNYSLKISGWAYAFLFIILVAVFPLWFDAYRLNIVSKYLALAFVAIGIVLTWGYGGILSLGQGVFFGIGGYLMAMFLKLEASAPDLPDFMVWSSVDVLPLWWRPYSSFTMTLLSIVLIPAVLAFGFAYAIFRKRVSGVYFAIVTLSLALTLSVLIIGQQGGTGGSNGITDFSTLLGHDILSDEAITTLYYIQLVLLFCVAALASLMIRTRLGKLLIAIRDREDRVRFSGYDTAMIKAFVFMVAAVFASIGGAFYTVQVGLIGPSVVGVMSSVEMVIYAAVGGRLSVPGAIVGALLVGFARSYFSEYFPETWLFFLGGLFIAVVMILPNGLADAFSRMFQQLGKRRYAK